MTLGADEGYLSTVKVRRRSVETRGDEIAKSPTTCAQEVFHISQTCLTQIARSLVDVF